jgi:hypothetical protein
LLDLRSETKSTLKQRGNTILTYRTQLQLQMSYYAIPVLSKLKFTEYTATRDGQGSTFAPCTEPTTN